MKIPKRIIAKAIEGGYSAEAVKHFGIEAAIRAIQLNSHATLLNPLFWQALGKALGWNKCVIEIATCEKGHHLPPTYTYEYCPKDGTPYSIQKIEGDKPFACQGKAMEFFDLILTGGDTEKFWNEIDPI